LTTIPDIISPAKVGDQSRTYLVFMAFLFIGIAGVTLVSAYFISHSITTVIKATANNLLTSAEFVATASTQLSETSLSLAEGASTQAASIAYMRLGVREKKV
jgi:methyl-accepting chemotaxis protein